MSDPRPRRVLQLGPSRAAMGGMAEVASLLHESPVLPRRGFVSSMVDSGGGRGRSGYAAFPAAVWQVFWGRYDLLHLHVASGGSVIRKALLAEAGARRRRPYVVHLHGGGFEGYLDQASHGQLRLTRRLFQRASAVVVLGQRWAELVMTRLGVERQRVHIVPNGVRPLVEEPLRTDRQEVVFVGGLTKAKGIDVLLDALETHVGTPQWTGWRFVLIGPQRDPELATRLRRFQRAHPGVVELAGPLFGAEKADVVSRASIFVLTSRAEGLPLVVLEAMSAGLTCVATDVGSTREVISSGVDGFLVSSGNATELSKALEACFSSQETRRRTSIEARSTWEERFSADVMADHMVDVWDGVQSLA